MLKESRLIERSKASRLRLCPFPCLCLDLCSCEPSSPPEIRPIDGPAMCKTNSDSQICHQPLVTATSTTDIDLCEPTWWAAVLVLATHDVAPTDDAIAAIFTSSSPSSPSPHSPPPAATPSRVLGTLLEHTHLRDTYAAQPHLVRDLLYGVLAQAAAWARGVGLVHTATSLVKAGRLTLDPAAAARMGWVWSPQVSMSPVTWRDIRKLAKRKGWATPGRNGGEATTGTTSAAAAAAASAADGTRTGRGRHKDKGKIPTPAAPRKTDPGPSTKRTRLTTSESLHTAVETFTPPQETPVDMSLSYSSHPWSQREQQQREPPSFYPTPGQHLFAPAAAQGGSGYHPPGIDADARVPSRGGGDDHGGGRRGRDKSHRPSQSQGQSRARSHSHNRGKGKDKTRSKDTSGKSTLHEPGFGFDIPEQHLRGEQIQATPGAGGGGRKGRRWPPSPEPSHTSTTTSVTASQAPFAHAGVDAHDAYGYGHHDDDIYGVSDEDWPRAAYGAGRRPPQQATSSNAQKEKKSEKKPQEAKPRHRQSSTERRSDRHKSRPPNPPQPQQLSPFQGYQQSPPFQYDLQQPYQYQHQQYSPLHPPAPNLHPHSYLGPQSQPHGYYHPQPQYQSHHGFHHPQSQSHPQPQLQPAQQHRRHGGSNHLRGAPDDNDYDDYEAIARHSRQLEDSLCDARGDTRAVLRHNDQIKARLRDMLLGGGGKEKEKEGEKLTRKQKNQKTDKDGERADKGGKKTRGKSATKTGKKPVVVLDES
ncbi:hypothetical protein GGR56DRAFT_153935 [Xylariaceae sp. FL0804]|nr:hypothetical protein GGR56DRAFT_153935 [Xylariaceae sp. FL0804]